MALTPAALDLLHLIHRVPPFLLLSAPTAAGMPPKEPQSSSCIPLHLHTLSGGLADTQAVDSLRSLCGTQGYGGCVDVLPPRAYVLESWSSVWYGRAGVSERPDLSGSDCVPGCLLESTLPSS